MADDRHFVGGDWYRICDRSGFKIRAGRTRKQWNDIIVREESFENRQPQDFVRGRADPQIVPEPRPRHFPFQFIGPAFPVPNLITQSDQQALGWPGVLSDVLTVAGVAPNKTLMLAAGLSDSGAYLSSPSLIDLGSVRRALVFISVSVVGMPRRTLSIPNVANVIPSVDNSYVRAHAEISLGLGLTTFDLFSYPDLFAVANLFQAAPVMWGPWQKAANTVYATRFLRFRVVVDSFDENTSAFVYGFNYRIGAAP
ncbi:MAG: hypothetical protein WDN46_10370 [Methylocella sp.]